MKKIVLFLSSLLICCTNVNATEKVDVMACEALSNENMYCSINEDGKCECVEYSINLTNVEHQEGAD